MAFAHIAGVDAVFRQRLGAGGHIGQQAVAVVMKVTDQRHIHAHFVQLLANIGHGLRGFGRVDGDAHDLRTRIRQLAHLYRRAYRVFGVGIGHALHAHGRAAAYGDHALAPHHPRLQVVALGGLAQGDGARNGAAHGFKSVFLRVFLPSKAVNAA